MRRAFGRLQAAELRRERPGVRVGRVHAAHRRVRLLTCFCDSKPIDGFAASAGLQASYVCGIGILCGFYNYFDLNHFVE